MPLVLRASRHPERALPQWNLLKRAAELFKRRRAAATHRRADAIVARYGLVHHAVARERVSARALPIFMGK